MKVFRRLNWQIFIYKSSLKFNSLSELEVKKEILNLSSKKATRKGDIPARILKNSISTCSSELTTPINNCLKKGDLPSDLKLVGITPIFKKKDLFAYCLICQKSLKILYTNKLIVLCKTNFHFT